MDEKPRPCSKIAFVIANFAFVEVEGHMPFAVPGSDLRTQGREYDGCPDLAVRSAGGEDRLQDSTAVPAMSSRQLW